MSPAQFRSGVVPLFCLAYFCQGRLFPLSPSPGYSDGILSPCFKGWLVCLRLTLPWLSMHAAHAFICKLFSILIYPYFKWHPLSMPAWNPERPLSRLYGLRQIRRKPSLFPFDHSGIAFCRNWIIWADHSEFRDRVHYDPNAYQCQKKRDVFILFGCRKSKWKGI